VEECCWEGVEIVEGLRLLRVEIVEGASLKIFE
jgi:hypothetical protein